MDKQELLNLITEISLVQSDDLREKCIAVWLEAIHGSTWYSVGKLEECPFALGGLSDDCPEKLLDHCRRVIRLCYEMYDVLEGYINKIGPCNKEYLVAAAVIHDVTKLWEYRYVEDGVTIRDSTYGKLFYHPISGAYLGKKHGLPDEVVFAVINHSDLFSPGGAKRPHTPESYLMMAIDGMVYEYARLYYGKN